MMNAITDQPARRGPTLTRRGVLALAATVSIAIAAVLVGAAAADTPTFSEDAAHIVTDPYIKCGTFVVVGDFNVSRRIATFYDSDGSAIRRVAHIDVDGTLTNAATGASLDFLREGTFTQDLIDGSTVTAGQRTHVTAPGGGIVLQDMGRIVREAGAVVFEAGPTDFLDYQSGDSSGVQDLCAALSA
jgi:hypothetical protein